MIISFLYSGDENDENPLSFNESQIIIFVIHLIDINDPLTPKSHNFATSIFQTSDYCIKCTVCKFHNSFSYRLQKLYATIA